MELGKDQVPRPKDLGDSHDVDDRCARFRARPVSAQRRDGVKYGRLARQSENDVRRRIGSAGHVDPPLPIVNMHTQHRCNPAVGSASDRPPIQRLEPFVRARERRLMFMRIFLRDDHHAGDIHQSRASETILRSRDRSA